MKVSVIIRTFNRGYVVGEAIRSVINQSFKNLEILLVDDGSEDDTYRLVKAHFGRNVRYVRHTVNKGVGAACNTGILHAAGELVAFLDSDDLWKPGYLAHHVSFISGHPEVDITFSDVAIHGPNRIIPSLIERKQQFPHILGHPAEGRNYILEARAMYLCLLEELPIKMIAWVGKIGPLTRAGPFNETWKSGEDWEFFLRLSRFARFGYIDLPLAIQRLSRDSTNLMYFDRDKLSLLELLRNEKSNSKHDAAALKAISRGIQRHCHRLGRHYLESGLAKRSAAICLRGFCETGHGELLLAAIRAGVFGLRALRRPTGRQEQVGTPKDGFRRRPS